MRTHEVIVSLVVVAVNDSTPDSQQSNVSVAIDYLFCLPPSTAAIKRSRLRCHVDAAVVGVGDRKGKGGTAEGTFWFQGLTRETNTSVSYVLFVFGIVDGWPPSDTSIMTMTGWEFKTANENREIRNQSCIFEGVFDVNNPMKIEVTLFVSEQ